MSYEDNCDEIRSLLTQMLAVVPREHTPKLVRMERAFDKITTEIEISRLMVSGPCAADYDIGRTFGLTGKEGELLVRLRQAGSRGIGKEALMTALYDNGPDCDWPTSKIIDIFVCKLRKKLKDQNAPFWIETVWGIGYRYREGHLPVNELTTPTGRVPNWKPGPQYMQHKKLNDQARARVNASRRAKAKPEGIAA